MKKGLFIKTTIFEYFNENKTLDNSFWLWFGNSIMVDESKTPIIFYHGSNVNRRFSKFNNNNPIWFSKYEGYAKSFISNKGKIFKVFLKLENPLYVGEIDGIANIKKLKYLSELTNINVNVLSDILKQSNGVNIFNITNSDRFKKIVQDMGYDGLEAKEGGGLTTYAVFYSNQIKSITNKGYWDIKNDDINY